MGREATTPADLLDGDDTLRARVEIPAASS
jgi:hypothetical protein